MKEKENFDFNDCMEELYARVETAIEDIMGDQIECAVRSAVQDIFEEALGNSLSRFEFVLKDGSVLRPRQLMKLVSPDKKKMLLCYGGLRVDGHSLIVQTGGTCWETIAYYNNKEEAVAAFDKVKNAMKDEMTMFEL